MYTCIFIFCFMYSTFESFHDSALYQIDFIETSIDILGILSLMAYYHFFYQVQDPGFIAQECKNIREGLWLQMELSMLNIGTCIS